MEERFLLHTAQFGGDLCRVLLELHRVQIAGRVDQEHCSGQQIEGAKIGQDAARARMQRENHRHVARERGQRIDNCRPARGVIGAFGAVHGGKAENAGDDAVVLRQCAGKPSPAARRWP